MVQFQMNIVTGYMASLDMKRHAQDIGHAGTELPLNSYVVVVFYIMNKHIVVIGLKMLMDVRSIVSSSFLKKELKFVNKKIKNAIP